MKYTQVSRSQMDLGKRMLTISQKSETKAKVIASSFTSYKSNERAC